jgi:hypothetical protein
MIRNPETDNQSRATLIKANEAIADIYAPIPGANPSFFPIPVRIPTQAKNMFLNGDASHSVCTWNDPPPPAGDRNEECAWFFTNDAPSLGQVLSPTTS